MADTSTRFKMNVRSPYYVVAEDTIVAENTIAVPDEYSQPATLTEAVSCDSIVRIGEDVGVRHFDIQTENRTGNIQIGYDVNVPVKISATWDSTTIDVENGDFVGDSNYQQALLDAGIAASDMTLTSGGTSGAIQIFKTTATPETVRVTVTAPLKNDDYALSFVCPDKPSATAVTADLINIPAFLVPLTFTCNELIINGQSINFGGGVAEKAIIIADAATRPTINSGKFTWQNSDRDPALFIDRAQYLQEGFNSLTFKLKGSPYLSTSRFRAVRAGIFNDGTDDRYLQLDEVDQFGFFKSPDAPDSIFQHLLIPSISGGSVDMTFTWTENSTTGNSFFDNRVFVEGKSFIQNGQEYFIPIT